jgi:next-to-BRCA1 protein 1
VTDFSKLRGNSDTSSEDDMSDSSSVSLVSAPFSEEDEDDRLWEASRAHEAAESVAQNMEYVLLYDDNTSDED